MTRFPEPEFPTHCFVYWNLTKKCWSIRSHYGIHRGRVVSHAKSFYIPFAEFEVSQAGRQRVLDQQRKNVHAGVVGTILGYIGLDDQKYGLIPQHPFEHFGKRIAYNPYYNETFVETDAVWPEPDTLINAAWRECEIGIGLCGFIQDGESPILLAERAITYDDLADER